MFLGKVWSIFGGEDGIRTHVPSYPDHLISSQRRYDRFGTSPYVGMIHRFGLVEIKPVFGVG